MGKGIVTWRHTYECENNNGINTTIELMGDCNYHISGGYRGRAPSLSHPGEQPEPPEITYSHFTCGMVEVTLWQRGDDGVVHELFNVQSDATGDYAAYLGGWFEDVVENDHVARGILDESVYIREGGE